MRNIQKHKRIVIKGIISNYNHKQKKYLRSEAIKKPKCVKCHHRVNILRTGNNGNTKHIGYYCKFCNYVYIDSKFMVFKI